MAKTCVNCGRKIGVFNDSLESNDVVLCYDCAKPIRDDLSDLYCLKSKKEFFELRDKIIQKSKKLYGENVTFGIAEKIEWIYDYVKPDLQDDVSEKIPKIEIKKLKEPVVSSEFTSQESFSLDDLYTDIGKKIKKWAKWIFIVEAIGAIIAGLVLIINAEEGLILYGFLALILGPVVAFVGSWVLYALGEFVDKTVENEKNTRNILELLKNKKD